MLRIQGLILLALIYTALIVAAVLLRAWGWITIPAGILLTVFLAWRDVIAHREKIEVIHKRLSNLRSEGLIIGRYQSAAYTTRPPTTVIVTATSLMLKGAIVSR